MRILHASYSAPPDPPAGTEIYVEGLSRALVALGHQSIIAAPGNADELCELSGVRVRRFACDQQRADVRVLYARDDSEYTARLERILHEEAPDVVHQHALTSAVPLGLVEAAHRRRMPVVFTYHTPTVSCQRGTLLAMGENTCDGRLDVGRCTACVLHGLGVPKTVGGMLARIPAAVGESIGQAGLNGGPWTALRMSSLMTIHHQSLRRLFESIDVFVALTPWVESLLLANGVPQTNIVRSPHGIAYELPTAAAVRRPSHRPRVAHLGRLDPVKGTRLLVEAMRMNPDLPIELDIFGIVQSSTGAALLDDFVAGAAGDPRIRFLPPIDHSAVTHRLTEYDAVAVPSQCLETGPLVVLEAFAAGVPVIGSALGGIADLVRDGIDGMLVRPYAAVAAWGNALRRIGEDAACVTALRSGVRPPRSMAQVAREMHDIYVSLVTHGRAHRIA